MKMCYRGVSYDRSPVVPNLERESKINSGMASQTTQLKFMGQFCQKQIINLIVANKKTRFLGKVSSGEIQRLALCRFNDKGLISELFFYFFSSLESITFTSKHKSS